MKKVIGLICLVFILISCGENKVVDDDNLVDNNIEIKIEKKVGKKDKAVIEEQKDVIKNKSFIDESKYSESNKPAINLINEYIKNNLVKENIFGEIEIIKTYNYFESKANKNLTKEVYAKDNNNYYYFCSEWPACAFNFEKYKILEGKLKIINKFDYKIGNKEYLNGYIQGYKKMEDDRLKNQIILKNYGNGLVLKQDTKGFMYDELGSTILYLNGKELIGLANNLTTIFCDPSGPFNLCSNEQITDKLIRDKTANKFKILESNKDIKIDQDSNIKILYVGQYEAKDIYFIDLENKIIIKDKSGMDFFVEKIKQGKSGTFIMGKGGRGCGGGLFFIDNYSQKKDLFKNNCDEDLGEDFQEIIDFELMINKQIKIFYKGDNNKKMEKIIKI